MEYSHFRLLKTNATFKRHIKCMDTTICPRIHWFISCAAFVSSTGVKLRRESPEGAYSFLSWLAMVISLPRAQSGYLFCASSGTQGFLLWMVRSGILEARNSSLEFWPWKCHLPLAIYWTICFIAIPRSNNSYSHGITTRISCFPDPPATFAHFQIVNAPAVGVETFLSLLLRRIEHMILFLIEIIHFSLKSSQSNWKKKCLRSSWIYSMVASPIVPVSYTHLTLPTKRIV